MQMPEDLIRHIMMFEALKAPFSAKLILQQGQMIQQIGLLQKVQQP
jgi:hypothetical protein